MPKNMLLNSVFGEKKEENSGSSSRVTDPVECVGVGQGAHNPNR